MSDVAPGQVNFSLVADEIDRILNHLYGEYLVSGRPTKHGGLRFLDINSAKTFGFERTRITKDGNLIVMSAPYAGEKEAIEEVLKKVLGKDLAKVEVRASPDAGKEKKMFAEISIKVPSGKILSNDAIMAYSSKYKFYNTSEISKRVLRDYVVPLARLAMDNLILVIRDVSKETTPAA